MVMGNMCGDGREGTRVVMVMGNVRMVMGNTYIDVHGEHV
jgi:hypothetical protein